VASEVATPQERNFFAFSERLTVAFGVFSCLKNPGKVVSVLNFQGKVVGFEAWYLFWDIGWFRLREMAQSYREKSRHWATG
jgi:hypothetical protein